MDHPCGCIRIEFFGIPRQRAGVPAIEIELAGKQTTLGDVLTQLARRFPKMTGECFDDAARTTSNVTVNIGGKRFVSDPETPLRAGDSLLVMSADAGG